MTLKITGTPDEITEFLCGLAQQPLAEIEEDFVEDYEGEEDYDD